MMRTNVDGINECTCLAEFSFHFVVYCLQSLPRTVTSGYHWLIGHHNGQIAAFVDSLNRLRYTF